MRSIRLEEIEQFICQRGFVPMDELCAHFGVSMNTIRRDITELLSRGAVEKVYGGVSAKRGGVLTPYPVRNVPHGSGEKISTSGCGRDVRDPKNSISISIYSSEVKNWGRGHLVRTWKW